MRLSYAGVDRLDEPVREELGGVMGGAVDVEVRKLTIEDDKAAQPSSKIVAVSSHEAQDVTPAPPTKTRPPVDVMEPQPPW